MRAYVLSIGSELIAGNITDTNATFLAQELVAVGIELIHVTQVGDDRRRLVATLRHALSEAELVICTGGVGPTDDDLTREAIAEVAGETPAVEGELLHTIQAFFASRGLVMPAGNAKQAWLIPSAAALLNPVGTAPGWFARVDGRIIVAMPGVPREMFRMWREEVLPRLRPSLPDRVIEYLNLKTLGLGESAVAQQIDDLIKAEHPVVATYAKDDGVHVRVSVSAGTAEQAETLLRPVVTEVRRRLGNHVYTDTDCTLASVLLAELRQANQTLGIVEIGTGGRFGALLLSEPEAGHFMRGCLASATTGAAPKAPEVADMARQRFEATLGLGVVAAIEPAAGGQFEGTISVALTGTIAAHETFALRALFAEVQRRSALNAADVLHRALLASP
ncbi:MAG: CinA family nicotinamide mononucleotide deamidase-related protein [Chloroflexota bacterium]|nr:CinA family nicotinamide mononucleotide deamidase-related protein [Chloroflexota bacterium]